MPPGTKPPSSHQTRPPLASRLRASFELKRSRSKGGHSRSNSRSEEHTGLIADSTGGSNDSPVTPDGFLSHSGKQDTETLRTAIEQAITSDAFQTAIAAHLAKLIKPSIKSALDTIQPLVEAVYTHEVLLRKTNQNVEDALERMETTTNASQRASRITLDGEDGVAEQSRQAEAVRIKEVIIGGTGPELTQFKQQMEQHNMLALSAIGGLSVAMKANNDKIEEVAEGVLEVKANLGPNIDSLKTITEESTTTISVLQAQLDQLKLDIAQILEGIGSDLGKNVQAIHERSTAESETVLLAKHTNILDAISTDLTVLKEHSDIAGKLDAISAELAVLKESVEGGIASNSEGFTSLGTQLTGAVAVIEGHTTLLSDLKDSPPHPDLLAAVQESNESHVLHAAALGELKDRSVSAAPISDGETPSENVAALNELKSELALLKTSIETGLQSHGDNITGLDAKIDIITGTIGTIKESDSSPEILLAVQQSNASHANHTAILEGMKSVAGEDSQFGPQITTIITTLEAHTTALEEIRTSSGSHAVALEGHATVLESIKSINSEIVPASSDSITSLETHVASMVSTLEAHTAALDELKGTSMVHSIALETHGVSLDGIKSLGVASEAAPSTVDLSPLESQITALASTLEAHSATLEEIKSTGASHTTILEGHGSMLESIKSIGDAPVSDTPGSAGLETQVNNVLETLQTHTSLLEELKGTASTHTAALAERSGVEAAEGGSTSDIDVKLGSLATTLETHSLLLDEIKTTGGTHTTVLDEIKTAHTTHASALEDIKSRALEHGTLLEEIRSPGLPPLVSMGMPMPDTLNLAALDIQIGSIVTTLSTHTSALADIGSKVGAMNASNLSADTDRPSLGDLNTVIEILDAHTTALNEIKEDVSAELLTAIHTVDQKQQNCENLLVEVREGDVSEELLTLMHGFSETTNGHAASLKNLHEAVQASRVESDTAKSIDATDATNPVQVDLSSLETQIAALHTVLGEHKDTLASINEFSIASRDLHIAHGVSLDEIKSRALEPAAIPDTAPPGFTSIEAKLDNLIAALDDHKTTINSVRDTTATIHDLHVAHGTSLDEIKSRAMEPAAVPSAAEMPSFEGLETKLDNLISSLEDHKTTLSTVKDTTTASHELHTSHGTVLDELKSKLAEPAPTPEMPSFEGLEGKIDGIISCLEEHKATLSTVNDTTTASQESHAAHTVSLDELKSRSIEMPDLSGLDTQLSGIVASLEEHKTVLSSLQDLHSTHTASLDEIKSKSVDPVTAADVPNVSSVEPQLATIIASLEEHKAMLSTMQDLHGAHTASLDEIKSKSVDPAPALEMPDISGIAPQLGTIVASLEEHKAILSAIQDSHGAHAVSLEEIKSKSVDPVPAVEMPDLSPIDIQLGTIVTSLGEHKAMLSAMQELHSTHTASLDEIKSRSIDSNSSEEPINIGGLEAQLSSVIASLEEHKTMLSSIQELHGAHAASLEEITDKCVAPDHITGILNSLKEQKSSLSTLQEKTTALHDLHTEHASSLDQIKSRSVDATPETQPAINIESLESQISGITTSLEEQKSVLSELKDMHTTLAETHTAHSSILNEIKNGTAQSNESHTSHTVILGELKAIPEPTSPDLAAMEAHLNTILTKLESQTEALSSLKDGSDNSGIHEAVKPSHELLTINHELLTSHTGLLGEIKGNSSQDEITSALAEIKSDLESYSERVKDLHSSTENSFSGLSTALGAFAIGGAAGAGAAAVLSDNDTSVLSGNDVSDDVLAEVKAVREIVEGSKEDILSLRSQLETGHAIITTSLSSIEDGIKSEITGSETKLNEAIAAVHGDVKAIDLASMHSALEQHGTDVKSVITQMESVDGNVKALDLAPIHTSLEQHGTDVKDLAVKLESIDGGVKAIDLAPIQTALEQHGTNVKSLATHLEGIDSSVKAIDLAPIHAALEQHGSAQEQTRDIDLAPYHAALESHGAGIDSINAKLDSLDGSLKENTSHIQALHEGVHLNDTGVDQLKSHIVVAQTAAPAMTEGNWFSRKKSMSPNLERNNPVDGDDENSSVPAVLTGVIAGSAFIGGAAAVISHDEDDETLPTIAEDDENETHAKEIEPEALGTGTVPEVIECEQPAATTDEVLPVSEDTPPQEDSDTKEEVGGEPDSDQLPVLEEGEIAAEPLSVDDADTIVEPDVLEEASGDVAPPDDSESNDESDKDLDSEPLSVADESEIVVDTTSDDIPEPTGEQETVEETSEHVISQEDNTLRGNSNPEADIDSSLIIEASEPASETINEENVERTIEAEVKGDISEDVIVQEDNGTKEDDELESAPLLVVEESEPPVIEATSGDITEDAGEREVDVETGEEQPVYSPSIEPEAVDAAFETNENVAQEPQAESSQDEKGISAEIDGDENVVLEPESQVGASDETEQQPSAPNKDTAETEPKADVGDEIQVEDGAMLPEESTIAEPDVKHDSEAHDEGPGEKEADSNDVEVPVEEEPEKLRDDLLETDAVVEEVQDSQADDEVAVPESMAENPKSVIMKPLEDIEESGEPLENSTEPQTDDTPEKDIQEQREITKSEIAEIETPEASATVLEANLNEDEEENGSPTPGQLEDTLNDNILEDKPAQVLESNDELSREIEESATIPEESTRDEINDPAIQDDDIRAISLDADVQASQEIDHAEQSELSENVPESHDQEEHEVIGGVSYKVCEDTEEIGERVEIPEEDSPLDESSVLDGSNMLENAESSEDDKLEEEGKLQENDNLHEDDKLQEDDNLSETANVSDEVDVPSNSNVPVDADLHEEISMISDSANLQNATAPQEDLDGPIEVVQSDVEEITKNDSDAPRSLDMDTKSVSNLEDSTNNYEQGEIGRSQSIENEDVQSQDDRERDLDSAYDMPISESRHIDQDTRETVPPSSPFIERSYNADYSTRDLIDTPSHNPFASNNLQPSSPGFEPFPRFSVSRQESYPVAVEEQEVGSEYESRAASPPEHVQDYSQHIVAGYSAAADYRQQQEPSRPSTGSSGSAFDSFSPRAPSPVEQRSYGQFPRHNAYQYEPGPRDLDYGGFGQQSPEIPSTSGFSTLYPIGRQAERHSQESLPVAEDYQRGSLHSLNRQVRDTSREYRSENSYHSQRSTSGIQQASFPIAEDYSPYGNDRQVRRPSQEYSPERSYHAEEAVAQSQLQQPFDLAAHENGEYSRRPTIEGHAAGAGYYVPSTTESHYSPSEHPDAAPEADPFAPMYSPTDVVDQYADTPSVYDQTPVVGATEYFGTTVGVEQSAHRRFDFDEEEIPPVFDPEVRGSHFETQMQDQYAAQRNTSPLSARPPPPITQNSGYMSHVGQQYMQQDTQRSEFGIPALSSQHTRYEEESSTVEHNPYETSLRGTSSLSHNGNNLANRSTSLELRDRYTSSPEPDDVEPRDEQYVQEQIQGLRRPPPAIPTRRPALAMPDYEPRYGNEEDSSDEEQDSPPETASFQPLNLSRNPFAARPAPPPIPTTPSYGLRYGREDEADESEVQYPSTETASFQSSYVSRNPFAAPTTLPSIPSMSNYEPRYGREDEEEEEQEYSPPETASYQSPNVPRNPFGAPIIPPAVPSVPSSGSRYELGQRTDEEEEEEEEEEYPPSVATSSHLPYGASNPFAEPAAQSSFPHLPPRQHEECNFTRPVRNDWDDEISSNAASNTQNYPPRDIPQRGYGNSFVDPTRNSQSSNQFQYSSDAASLQQRYQPQELLSRPNPLDLESPTSNDRFMSDGGEEVDFTPRELPSNGYGGIAQPTSSSYGGFDDSDVRPSLSQQLRRYPEEEEQEDEHSDDELPTANRAQNYQSGPQDRRF